MNNMIFICVVFFLSFMLSRSDEKKPEQTMETDSDTYFEETDNSMDSRDSGEQEINETKLQLKATRTTLELTKAIFT